MLKYLESILKRVKLSRQVTIILSIIFVAGIITSCKFYFPIIDFESKQEIKSKALQITEVFNYVYQVILDDCIKNFESGINQNNNTSLDIQSRTCSQNMSARLITPIAKKLKDKNSSFNGYIYKVAILNSSETAFKADKSEQDVIDGFKHTDSDKPTELILSDKGVEPYYFIAKPIKNHRTGEIIGAHFVYVKANELSRYSSSAKKGILMITIGACVVNILLVNLWLKQFVVRPLNQIARVAEAVSQGNIGAEFERISNDEIGRLAEAFRRMKESLAIAMKRLEDYRIERLQ